MFEGEFLNGKKWNGNFMFENEDYKKEYYELKEGKGYIKTNFFEGEYLNGERNGKGKIHDNGQIKFEGEFLDKKMEKENIFQMVYCYLKVNIEMEKSMENVKNITTRKQRIICDLKENI